MVFYIKTKTKYFIILFDKFLDLLISDMMSQRSDVWWAGKRKRQGIG